MLNKYITPKFSQLLLYNLCNELIEFCPLLSKPQCVDGDNDDLRKFCERYAKTHDKLKTNTRNRLCVHAYEHIKATIKSKPVFYRKEQKPVFTKHNRSYHKFRNKFFL
jgi:hypothetical protein